MIYSYSYSLCRESFRDIAKSNSASLATYRLPYYWEPYDDELSTDVASIGNRDAPNVIVVSSGIHGAELRTGSRLQSLWLSAAKESCLTRDDLRFVFVHALNPFGAAYELRNDQDNIDVNRNFIDFKQPLPPTSESYRALSGAFLPPDLEPFAMARAWGKMIKFVVTNFSIPKFEQALAGGQYEFPEGLYYGGKSPSWTRQTWEKIIHDHVSRPGLKNVWHVDIHTGYGPRGAFQLMVNTKKDSPLHERVERFALPGSVKITETSFAALTGDIVDFWPQLGLGEGVVVTPLAVEIGTSKSLIQGIDVLHAMITRNALRQRHDDCHPDAKKIVRGMSDVFAPPEADWQNKAREDGQQFWQRLVASIAPHP